MAFLQKLFQRQNSRKNQFGPGETKYDWKRPQFDEKSIRLALILDSDNSGRKILFDSKAVITEDETPSCRTKCRAAGKLSSVKEGKIQDEIPAKKHTPTYQPSRTGSDGKWLEEMMFGAEGVAYKGKSLKVHVIRSPPKLMLTKVFIPEKPKRMSSLDGESLGCSYSSVPDLAIPRSLNSRGNGSNIPQSVPVDVPIHSQYSLSKSMELADDDSGRDSLNSSGSYQHPSPSGSYNSLPMERRLNRSQAHSFGSLGSMKRRSSMQDSLGVETPVTLKIRRGKMALGIMFDTIEEKNADANRLFEKFFFSHIALFEGHLEKMRLDVEKAYYTGKWNLFLTGMIEAFETFKVSISDLYTARRLPDPIWLNMMSYSSYRYMLCEKFLKEFVGLASRYDGKTTNNFISTLVTTVLTHHLAWVPTVIPAGGKPSDTYLEKHSAKWVDTLAKSHPYNPLWAQLSDLYGAIGFPLKLSRTIVIGKKGDLVKKILYVLSYFIRCSDILENSEMGNLESYIRDIEPETPCDSDKSFIPATPTPTADLQFKPELPACPSPYFHSLNLDSLASNKTSVEGKCAQKSSLGEASETESQVEQTQTCSGCLLRKQSQQTENKVGNSVFYVESNCSCQCESSNKNLSNNATSTQGHKEIPVKKNCLNLTLSLTDKDVESVDELTAEKPESCKMSTVNMIKDPEIANIQLVRRSAHCDKELDSKSGLQSSFTKEEIKSAYLKSGSNSMFDEYFHDGSEAKTIDEVHEDDRVVDLRSDSKQRHVSGVDKMDNTNKAPSLPDLMSEEQIDEQESRDTPKSPRSRLGSWDPTFKQRKISFSRQLSETNKNVPGRCRPVTPTELGKRRHVSSNSSIDVDFSDPRAFCRELPMPCFDPNNGCVSQKETEKNFGRSLLADYSDHYMSDFVLHGTSEKNIQEKLVKDLQMSIQYSVLDEPIAEAVCIVADTERWTVHTYSSQHLDRPGMEEQLAEPSLLITNLISTVQNMWKLKMSPEFCIMHLEDRLQEIFFKSKMLAEYIKRTKTKNTKELQEMFGFHTSDLPLLMAIAGTHMPNVPLVCLP